MTTHPDAAYDEAGLLPTVEAIERLRAAGYEPFVKEARNDRTMRWKKQRHTTSGEKDVFRKYAFDLESDSRALAVLALDQELAGVAQCRRQQVA